MWPHELVYMAIGQPAVYKELSVPLFMSGYLAVKPAVKPVMSMRLKELMADAEVHVPVGTGHGLHVPCRLAPANRKW